MQTSEKLRRLLSDKTISNLRSEQYRRLKRFEKIMKEKGILKEKISGFPQIDTIGRSIVEDSYENKEDKNKSRK